MASRVSLQVVEPVVGQDSIISVAQAGFPIMKGTESAFLACGACREVLAWNMSPEKLLKTFIVVHHLILLCRCGAHNLAGGAPGQPE